MSKRRTHKKPWKQNQITPTAGGLLSSAPAKQSHIEQMHVDDSISTDSAVHDPLANVGITLAPTYELIALDKVRIPSKYQRRLNVVRVRKIAKEFDERQFTPVEVSLRDDGFCYAFDGMHHYHAAVLRGYDPVPCLVHKGLTIEQEAGLFRLKNSNRVIASPRDDFRAAVVQNDERFVEINKILLDLDIEIGKEHKARRITAVGQLLVIEKEYGVKALRDTLSCIVAVWPNDMQNTSTDVIGGVAEFLRKYGDKVNSDRFVERFSTVSLPQVLSRYTKRTISAGIDGKQTSPLRREAMCKSLAESYNRGLHSGPSRLVY